MTAGWTGSASTSAGKKTVIKTNTPQMLSQFNRPKTDGALPVFV